MKGNSFFLTDHITDTRNPGRGNARFPLRGLASRFLALDTDQLLPCEMLRPWNETRLPPDGSWQ
jgi:hypothetical protein